MSNGGGGGNNGETFNDTLNRGADLITQKYQNATEPQLRAAAVMNGTLGGGDYQNQVKNAQTALGQELGNYTSGMQNDQYNRAAQLQEQDLGRATQTYDNERNRQMTAQQLAQNDQNLTMQRYNARPLHKRPSRAAANWRRAGFSPRAAMRVRRSHSSNSVRKPPA
jgi:hypothetical protein